MPNFHAGEFTKAKGNSRDDKAKRAINTMDAKSLDDTPRGVL